MDERNRSGPVEGAARSEARTSDEEGRGRAVGSDGSEGEGVGSADAEGGRRRDFASAARACIESEDRGEDPAEGSEVGGGEVPGFWADFGERVPGEAGGSESQQGDAAAVADRGGGVEEEKAASGGGARVEAATELPGGGRARGHVRARLAGRTRGEAVSDRPDRRCQQPAAGALCKTRLDGREPAGAAELPGAVGTAPSVLHGPGGIVPDESAGQPGR